jgi:hypothetical protein
VRRVGSFQVLLLMVQKAPEWNLVVEASIVDVVDVDELVVRLVREVQKV